MARAQRFLCLRLLGLNEESKCSLEFLGHGRFRRRRNAWCVAFSRPLGSLGLRSGRRFLFRDDDRVSGSGGGGSFLFLVLRCWLGRLLWRLRRAAFEVLHVQILLVFRQHIPDDLICAPGTLLLDGNVGDFQLHLSLGNVRMVRIEGVDDLAYAIGPGSFQQSGTKRWID